jgi:hypothetical protein
MARAARRSVVAFIALACMSGFALRVSAEGFERSTPGQPFELWSKTSSGLGALEPRCEPASRAPFRVQETIDPWAKPLKPCEAERTLQPTMRTAEIVYPWPDRRANPPVASYEIVDPWAARR